MSKYKHPDSKVVVESTEADAERYTSQGWTKVEPKSEKDDK